MGVKTATRMVDVKAQLDILEDEYFQHRNAMVRSAYFPYDTYAWRPFVSRRKKEEIRLRRKEREDERQHRFERMVFLAEKIKVIKSQVSKAALPEF